jgi:hypothetical protein
MTCADAQFIRTRPPGFRPRPHAHQQADETSLATSGDELFETTTLDPNNRTLYSHEDSTEKVSHAETSHSEDVVPVGLRDFYGFAIGAEVRAN